MKALAIAIKDIRQSSRTALVWVFMFVVPLGITLMFYFMFGNIAAGDEFELPQTAVVLVNLDQGTLPGGGSMGTVVADILQQEDFAELLRVTESADAATARAAVDNGEHDVAVILPSDFTDVLLQGNATTAVELHKDPTLTLGPAVVESILETDTRWVCGDKHRDRRDADATPTAGRGAYVADCARCWHDFFGRCADRSTHAHCCDNNRRPGRTESLG